MTRTNHFFSVSECLWAKTYPLIRSLVVPRKPIDFDFASLVEEVQKLIKQSATVYEVHKQGSSGVCYRCGGFPVTPALVKQLSIQRCRMLSLQEKGPHCESL